VVWSRAPGQIFLRSGTRWGSSFPTTFVRRQGSRQDTRNQFYSLQRIRKRAIIIIVISYLVLFFWGFASSCQHIPQLFYRNSCWDHSQPFVVFPYVQRWLYTTDIVYTLYSQHSRILFFSCSMCNPSSCMPSWSNPSFVCLQYFILLYYCLFNMLKCPG
jgi:hypothetical protein